MGVGGQHHTLAALPPGKNWYPLYTRLGGPKGRSGQVWKILPPLGYDPQTVQPIASHYTDYAILAHYIYIYIYIYKHTHTQNQLQNTALSNKKSSENQLKFKMYEY